MLRPELAPVLLQRPQRRVASITVTRDGETTTSAPASSPSRKGAVVREHRVSKLAEQCIAAGVPPEYAVACAQSKQPPQIFMAEVEKQKAAKRKMLLVAGGAGALLLLLLWRRR